MLYQSNPLPMCVYDRETLRFLTVNDAAILHYGYSLAEFQALRIVDLHAPEQRDPFLAALNDPSNNFERPSVWKHRKKDGSPADVEVSLHDLTLDGRAARLMLVKDITEHLNLEAQLRQSQKLDSVGRLAAGVAHDFNNILSVIQGHACLLLSDRELSPELSDSLNQVRAATERAANLTRQLLTFSRRQFRQLRVLDLNETVANVAKMLERLLEAHIALDLRLAPRLPPIKADLGMVEQILVNLSVNSRDAMPQGGRLVITTEAAIVDERRARTNPESAPGSYVLLTVTDTGCGIDAATLPRIFEPFFTTKEVGKGTGLGLATVYGIVKQHQGWVEVASQPGQGATFRVYLPACPEEQPESRPETSGAPIRRGTERVMVVEDEPPVRMLVSHVLQSQGYQVVTANSGAEALQMWESEQDRVQLLLTDMMMPNGISGWELGARLQAARPQLKVIYTSGYSIDLIGRNIPLREGYNFLQKPYPPRKLVQTVRQRLDGVEG